jgi:peptidoglycan hydrolase CwlO-like protein
MSKPKIFQKVLIASGLSSIPFVTQETLTSQDGYLVSEEGVAKIEAALEASEKLGDVSAVQSELNTATASLTDAQANLATATTSLTDVQAQLTTAKTDLQAAKNDAATWKAKAIEFGAKPADVISAEVPGTDPKIETDATTATLDALPHNQKADRLFGK